MSKLPAPTIHQPRGQLPVLLSVPHSGRDYPDWLLGLASAGRDRTVRLWAWADGKEIACLTGHTAEVNCVRFAPDGNAFSLAAIAPGAS